ncbi:MAG: LPS export ABC transporter permease LptG [Desulfosarcinaceae bacterium]|nr:LPS export ABC transporter permease LptG [Desulfosarcinaceae bacterium]
MSTIHRYVYKELARYLVMVLVCVAVLYLVVDFFEKADRFVKAGLGMERVLTFFVCNLPSIMGQIAPLGFLLAVLITFGLMGKNNEIVALKSGGVSPYYLMRPVLWVGLLMSVGLFLFKDAVVPVTLSQANRIWVLEVKKKQLDRLRTKNIWLKEKGRIIHVALFKPRNRTIHGVTINDLNDNFRLVRRLDARSGRFTDDGWLLSEVLEQRSQDARGEPVVRYHSEYPVDIHLAPDDFKQVVRSTDELSFRTLLREIAAIEADGFDARSQRVDLHAKVSFPLICLILALVGGGISLRGNRGEGIFAGILIAIGIAFCYWFSHSICLSLGYGGVLPPMAAAWATNLVFLCVGLFVIMQVE